MTSGQISVLLIDPSHRGGLPAYVRTVTEALSQCGARPTVLTSRTLPETTAPGRWLRSLPEQPWPRADRPRLMGKVTDAQLWLRSAAIVWKSVRSVGPDVVHVQHPLHPRMDPLLLESLRRRCPVVITAHDVQPHSGGRRSAGHAIRCYRASDAVIVHSQPAADLILDTAGVRAVVISHPPALVRPRCRAEARARLGIDESERVFAVVGYIRQYKGLGLIADTWELLGAGAPSLIVRGELVDESERHVVERLARHPHVRVHIGYSQDDELIDVLSASDAVLLPYDGGSDSGILHMARSIGVPVVASDSPQLAAAVSATAAGVVLPRDPTKWAQALLGRLPPRPPAPEDLTRTGLAHLDVYAKVLAPR